MLAAWQKCVYLILKFTWRKCIYMQNMTHSKEMTEAVPEKDPTAGLLDKGVNQPS